MANQNRRLPMVQPVPDDRAAPLRIRRHEWPLRGTGAILDACQAAPKQTLWADLANVD
jgi:hypothetical protein